QIRSYALSLELELAKTGSLQNHNTFWIGNTGGASPTCSDKTYYGPMAEDFRSLCQGIFDQYQIQSNNLLFVGVSAGLNDGSKYSITARLNNGQWYCRGSSGRIYEGPLNPGTGSGNGSGCFNNP